MHGAVAEQASGIVRSERSAAVKAVWWHSEAHALLFHLFFCSLLLPALPPCPLPTLSSLLLPIAVGCYCYLSAGWWNSRPCCRLCASGSAAPLGRPNAASSPTLLCYWFALDACCFSFLSCLVLGLAHALVQALVDGPATLTGVSRQTIPFRNLSLTSIKLEIPRAVRTGTLTKAFTKADVLGQWQKSSWAKKLARHQTRSELGDFDRFKLMLLRKKKSLLINREFAKLRRAANPQAKKAASAKKPAAAKKA